MSVLLEGDTVIQDETALWSGMWQFAKDKKVGVCFKYEVSLPVILHSNLLCFSYRLL